MKKFDIDKLERKMPYSVPDQFFDEVQKHVLSQTVHKIGNQPIEKKPSRNLFYKMNWAYSAAAALVAIFGVLFFINSSNNTDVTANTVASTIKDSAKELTTKSEAVLAIKSQSQAQTSEEEVKKAYDEFKNTELTNTDKVIASNTAPKTSSKKAISNKVQVANIKTNTSKSNVKTASLNAEAKVDQILDVLPDSELAELSQNTENDVYLDLYY